MSSSGSRWRRPVTKTYDYNFKLGEHYYKPQLDYLETRKGRAKTPPTAKTFAERFAEDPIYGRFGASNLRRAGAEGRGDGETLAARFGSLDDISLGQKGSLFSGGNDLQLGGSNSPRLVVGDRLLDAVGVKESRLSSALNLNSSSLSSTSRLQRQSESREGLESSSLSSRRKVGFAQSADADTSDDPFKTRVSSKLIAARKQADGMMEDMKREADSSVSRFRARAQARKEEQTQRREIQSNNEFGYTEDEETAAIRDKVNQIGLRAKARLAQLEDDFPEIHIGSSLAARRAAGNASSFYDDENDSSSKSASTKTVKITKRTIKSSYELE